MARANSNNQTRIPTAVIVLLLAGLLVPRAIGQDDAKKPGELETLRKSEQRQRLLAESRLYALQIAQSLRHWENGDTWWAREVLNRTDEKMRRFEFGWLQTLYNWSQQKVDLGYHHEPITGLACSPDGRRIATTFKDTIKVWDAITLKEVKTLGGDKKVFAFDPDSKRLLSGNVRGGMKIWDVETGDVIRHLSGHTKTVNDAKFSPDGKRIVSVSSDRKALIWDVKTGDELKILKGHRGDVYSVAFSPDGKWVATGSRQLRIWNTETGAERHVIRTRGTRVMSVAFSPDGKQVLTGHWDAGGKTNNYVELWDAETGKSIHVYSEFENRINSVAFAPDGRTFAAGGYENHIRICSVKTGQEIGRLDGYVLGINGVSFMPQENRLVSTSGGEIRVWNLRTPDAPVELQSPTTPQFGPKGDWIATRNDAVIELRDAHTLKIKRTLRGHTARVSSVAFHPNEPRLASASEDGTIRIWSTASGESVLTVKAKDQPVTSIDWSPKGAWLVSRERQPEKEPKAISLRVWNASTGELVTDVQPTDPSATHVSWTEFAFSPDDKSFVCPDPDQSIHVRDVATGEKQVRLAGENKHLTCLVYSPSGDRIAGAFSWPWLEGDYLKVWDAKTGKTLFAIHDRSGGFSPQVAFSPDGKRVVMPFARNVRTWDARTGKDPQKMIGHTATVKNAQYFPDSQRIVSTSDDGTVKIWNAAIGEELLNLPHGDKPYVTINHDGTSILTMIRNDTRPISFTVKLWHADGWKRPVKK